MIELATRLYALILRAYPRGFREQCGAPMLRTFEEWCRNTRANQGAWRFAHACAAELADAAAGIWRSRRPAPAARRETRRGDGWVFSLLQDTRRAVRRLATQPALVFFTVVTLGFAIAANATLFSVLDAVLLRRSPFAEPERLFQVMNQSTRGITHAGLSVTKLRFWRGETDLFEAVEAYRELAVIVTGGVEPEEVHAAEVSPGLLAMLGVAPRLGRVFTAADAESTQRVAIVGEHYWRTRFGADAGVIGRTITINGKPHAIAGVMPSRFHFPTLREDIWLPLDPASTAGGGRVANTIVRLRSDLTLAAAKARIDSTVARLNAERPLPTGWGILLDPGPLTGPDPRTERAVLVLFGAVALVLLTACANVANLLLSRAVDRQREFAIRRMLGAARGRLVRELVVEGLVLGLAAGALGLAAAQWALATLVRLMPEHILYATSQGIDVNPRVALFGMALALATGILCNVPPALRMLRQDGGLSLSGRTRTAAATPFQRRVRSALVVVEISFAVVLLAGAALMVRSFLKLNAVDLGFRPDRLLSVTVGLDAGRYETEASRVALLQRVAADVAALPGVDGVAIATGMPPDPGALSLATLETDAGVCSGEREVIVSNQVTPNYFALLGIAINDGRPLRADDPPDAAVVSRAVARRCGVESLTGRRVRLGPTADWLTVVGTAAVVKTHGLSSTSGELAVYLPWTAPFSVLPNVADTIERRVTTRRLVVATARPASLVADVKRILWSHDRDQPVLAAAPASELMADTIRRERFVLALMSLFSAVSLALASAGIFGVLAYSVAQRANEIGIRLALGASPAHVLRLVVGQGLVLAAAGTMVGVAGALAFFRVLAGLLFEVTPRDPAVFIAIPLLVFVVALLASWIPTSRALRVDPASALRSE
jgi:putative ABC transport system permease protein